MRIIVFVGLMAACSHSSPAPSQPAAAPESAAASAPAPAPAAGNAATPAVATAAAASGRGHRVAPGEGFEYQVRADFFDGLRGDTAALDRAIKVCEDTLAREPQHAEAMVWHGASMVARSSLAFRSGDRAQGIKLFQQGMGEMDHAVALAPENIGVRIPRGAVLLSAAQFVPEPQKSQLLARGTSDYELALAKQTPFFGEMTLHAREQLLYGLTDAFASLGDRGKAQRYYERMVADAAGSQLLPRAKARAAGEAVSGPTPCEQCHASRAVQPSLRGQ